MASQSAPYQPHITASGKANRPYIDGTMGRFANRPYGLAESNDYPTASGLGSRAYCWVYRS
jgi:hypothetical protein